MTKAEHLNASALRKLGLFPGYVPSELKTLIEVYCQHDDLIRAFPETIRGDFRGLLKWAVKYGITIDAARNVLEPNSDAYRKLLAQYVIRLGDEARLRLRKYLTGLGLDVGPLNCPFPEGRGYKILAVDVLTPRKIMEYFPQYPLEELRFPDVVCNIEYFNVFRPTSFDFVIASHVLEHLPDPIGSIESLIRILRPRGLLILIIPDKERTFDSGRPVTDLRHLLDVYHATPEQRLALEDPHYKEVAQIGEGRTSGIGGPCGAIQENAILHTQACL